MEKSQKLKIELHLIRHGQTEDNITATLAGHQPGKLTPQGVQQARQTGVFLKNAHFDYAYCSDLGRTKQTFQTIAAQTTHIKQMQPVYTPLIREKCGGILEGGPLKYWKENADKEGKDLRAYKCEKGESWEDVNERARQFIHLLIKNHLSNEGIMSFQMSKARLQDDGSAHKATHNKTPTSTEDKKPKSTNSIKDESTANSKSKTIKVMAVSHGGYIMEFHNVVKLISKGIPPVYNNSAKNCSIHIFTIEYDGDADQEIQDSKIKVQCIQENGNSHIK